MIQQVDLYSLRFWGVVAVASAVMIPLTGASARRWAFAAVNLGFLALYLDGEGLLAVVVGLVAAYGALRMLSGHRLVALVLVPGGLATLGLFLLHKTPGIASAASASERALALGEINPILTAIGFSYVALRLVDVALAVRDGRRPPPDLPSTVNYLLPFHMLAAGPIQAYDEFAAQPATPPALDAPGALGAFERIASGLFKKFILASALDRIFLTGFRVGGPYLLVEMNVQYVWLYLDFSAYSDIAVGVGRLMGIATPENFNRPFLARNSIDYWERWHISLSQFIRRNLFIPIQMQLMRWTDGRAPLLTASVAFTISFLLCGLWHSVGWNWMAWGAVQSAGLVACNLYRAVLLRRLGRKGLNRYLANRWIRAVMIAVTFEFMAFALLVATYPFSEAVR